LALLLNSELETKIDDSGKLLLDPLEDMVTNALELSPAGAVIGPEVAEVDEVEVEEASDLLEMDGVPGLAFGE
jgi:hypothetical protein